MMMRALAAGWGVCRVWVDAKKKWTRKDWGMKEK